jgi:hypothetical protein
LKIISTPYLLLRLKPGAAEILGLSKRIFLENASLHGVSLSQYDENELIEEIEQWQ